MQRHEVQLRGAESWGGGGWGGTASAPLRGAPCQPTGCPVLAGTGESSGGVVPSPLSREPVWRLARATPGGRGWLSTPGSRRSGRAQFGHPAPRAVVSLRANARTREPPFPAALRYLDRLAQGVRARPEEAIAQHSSDCGNLGERIAGGPARKLPTFERPRHVLLRLRLGQVHRPDYDVFDPSATARDHGSYPQPRDDRRDVGHLFGDGVGVRQSFWKPQNPVPDGLVAAYGEPVCAHSFDDAQRVTASAFRQTHQGHRGPDAQCHAGDGQRRCQRSASHGDPPTACRRQPRDTDTAHGLPRNGTSLRWGSRPSSATPRPSASFIRRWARAATFWSCDTTTTAWPRSANCSSRSSTSSPCAVSSAPVGSSARINCASFITARAMATRCCSPPDSSDGASRQRSGGSKR